MVTQVLDTNVIAKWFIQEEGSLRAETFLKELEQGRLQVVVPSSVLYELANILWVRRRDGLTEQYASEAWAEFSRLPIELRDDTEMVSAAIRFSYQHQISAYDSVFVVLARELGCDLITADVPLYNRVHESCPWVKLL